MIQTGRADRHTGLSPMKWIDDWGDPKVSGDSEEAKDLEIRDDFAGPFSAPFELGQAERATEEGGSIRPLQLLPIRKMKDQKVLSRFVQGQVQLDQLFDLAGRLVGEPP
jgi:hypothetical protein